MVPPPDEPDGRLRAALAQLAPDEPDGRLRAALAQLAPDDAEFLRLVGWEGLTPTEAAAVLGVTPAVGRVRLHRGAGPPARPPGRGRVPGRPETPGHIRTLTVAAGARPPGRRGGHVTNDDDGAALDARVAAASPARDRDVAQPEVHAAARALIEELLMPTQAPTPPNRRSEPGPEPIDAVGVVDADIVLTANATPSRHGCGGGRRALVGAAGAAVALGVAVAAVAGAGGPSDDPSPVAFRPAAAIRQDACRAATAWLDAGDGGSGDGTDDGRAAELQAELEALRAEAQAAAEAEASRSSAAAESERAATDADPSAEAKAQAEAERAAADTDPTPDAEARADVERLAAQAEAERAATAARAEGAAPGDAEAAELAAISERLEALRAAVEAEDVAAVQAQLTDAEAGSLGC